MSAPGKKIDPARLAGVAELAELFGVSRSTVSNWYRDSYRQKFPEPVAHLAMGPVWDIGRVVEWFNAYVPIKGQRPGRPPRWSGNQWIPTHQEKES